MVQWLRLRSSSAGGTSYIPGRVTYHNMKAGGKKKKEFFGKCSVVMQNSLTYKYALPGLDGQATGYISGSHVRVPSLTSVHQMGLSPLNNISS